MIELHVFFNKIHKWLSYSYKEKLLFIKVFFITGIYSFIINKIKLNKYSKILGYENQESAYEICEEMKYYAQKIGSIIEIVSKYTPWRSECFVKAMTVQKMLKHKGIESTMYMGVKRDDEKMIAHAWVRCGSIYVVGGNGENYAVVKKFKNTFNKK